MKQRINSDKNLTRLNKAKINTNYKITKFIENLPFYEQERLLAYGLTQNSIIRIIKKSLFKQTFLVNIRDCNLILNIIDTKKIIVQEV